MILIDSISYHFLRFNSDIFRTILRINPPTNQTHCPIYHSTSSTGGLPMPNAHVDEGLIVMPTKAITKS
ncbi:hypothetical protein [Salmonella phage ZC-S1_prp]|nr:hypothetical protein [Salmonella phage ZC-S1_prp]